MTIPKTGDRVKTTQHANPDGTPWPGTITAIGNPIPGVGRWVTIHLDRGYVIVVTDDKVSTL